MTVRADYGSDDRGRPRLVKGNGELQLMVWSVNHHRADTEARERVAFDDDGARRVMTACSLVGLPPVLALSTCNRTEIYLSAADPEESGPVLSLALRQAGIPAELFEGDLGIRLSGEEALRHLFRVSTGLDSMMVGEPQIAGQMKAAYRLAMDHRPLDSLLNKACEKAFRTSKRVRAETRIGSGAVSVAYAAVELSGRFFQDLGQRRALLVGAGDTGALAGRHFIAAGIGELTVVNRSAERGERLALELVREGKGSESLIVETCAWDRLSEAMVAADVVLSSTASPEPVIEAELVKEVMKRRRGKPLFILDVAVPKDVHPEVGKLRDVFSYDLDDLQEIVEANLELRRRELPKAERIIDSEAKQFMRWAKDHHIRPAVASFHGFLDEIKEAELARCRGRVTPETEAVVKRSLEGFIKRLLDRPVHQLKDAQEEIEQQRDVESLRRLFRLDADD